MSKRKMAMADVTPEDQEFIDNNATPAEAHAKGVHVSTGELFESEPETLESNSFAVRSVPDNDQGDDEGPDEGPTQEEFSNAPSTQKAKREYMKKVGKLGADHGAGGKALIELAKQIVEGAQEKVLSYEKKVTKGDGIQDDAKSAYEAFRRGAEKAGQLAEAPGFVPDSIVASGDASTKDIKNKSFDGQVSKLRRFLKFGNLCANMEPSPSEMLSTAIQTHVRMRVDNVQGLKYPSTYTAIGEFVGEQMKDDYKGVAMSAEEIYEFFLGKEPKDKTGIDLVRAALDSCNRALKGKAATDNQAGRDPVSSANLEEAVDCLRRTINELDPSGKTLEEIDDKLKKSAERAIIATFRASLKH